ncbi:alpha/beta hydrolase [Flavisolibacter nicotianae]|uniref:alpha/beta hydrolase n=1 Tax=Flavisolibacter nicotianae TaxID=2364882 RepID=UPI0019693C87|nr:alpha/beta hydrolase [Flavisolibacter nicotianae]
MFFGKREGLFKPKGSFKLIVLVMVRFLVTTPTGFVLVRLKTFTMKIFGSYLAAFIFLLQACNSNSSNSKQSSMDSSDHSAKENSMSVPDLKPKGPKPDWAKDIDDNMQVVTDKLASYGDPPIETLSAQAARKGHTPTDAVMDVMKENNIAMPPSMCDTMGKDIPVEGGTIHARIYTPKNGKGPFPMIVYYHGGGWVIADLNTYDPSAKALAEQTGAVVVSVHYRQGPEHKFPTAHNDAFAAYQWALQNAANINGNPKMVAVAGESAGGNLACNMSIMARDKGIQMPVHQLLVYPVASNDMNSESYHKYAAAKPLNKPMMEWFAKNYLGDMSKAADPRIALVNANLKGLPPTTVIGAEIDPLQTEGKLLADKLKDAGVDVDYKLYDGVTHEFFGMATVVPDAKDAQAYAASELKKSFNK